MNYWKQDTIVANNKLRQRNELEQVRYYIVTRYQSFFGELTQDNELRDQQIDASHFVTETLLKLWNCIFNDGNIDQRNPALISIYKK